MAALRQISFRNWRKLVTLTSRCTYGGLIFFFRLAEGGLLGFTLKSTSSGDFERSFITAMTGDRTADTSGQVINFNTNTAFKCVPHILGNLQFLQTVAELCADAHYYFAHSFNSPRGSKASSMCQHLHPEPPKKTLEILYILSFPWSLDSLLINEFNSLRDRKTQIVILHSSILP